MMLKPINKFNGLLKEQGIALHFDLSYIRGKEPLPEPLSPADEQKYLKLLACGSKEAKQVLIEHNLRLVVYIAGGYTKNHDIDIEDIISSGAIGLVKAIDTYKVNKLTKLSAYASVCINNEIMAFLKKENKNPASSLDDVLSTDSDGSTVSLADVIGTDKDEVSKMVENEADRELLLRSIANLTENEQTILFLRYGLCGHDKHTQEQVALIMGVTQSSISKLEKCIYTRLRQDLIHINNPTFAVSAK